ncbi:MAG: response regulator [Deltaproteobacteria bacterium]|nr:response regulator [Deltaproteobacteria bacterium]
MNERGMESRRPGLPADAGVGRATPPRAILIAEDDATFRTLLRATLEQAGYRVVEACSGADLLDRLADLALAPADEGSLGLVITDLRMPGLSGVDALRVVRAGPWRHVPVILITAFGDVQTHAQARALGVADVFDKPFDLAALAARVASLVPAKPRALQSSSSSTSRAPCA